MRAFPVVDGIQWVGVVDWDRRLFDGLIPLPDGTSYNSYLVRGSEKTALIDTVDPAKMDVLLSRLKDAGVTRLDYVVANHAEQDHSGTIPRILAQYPDAKVLLTDKCKGMLSDLLHLPDSCMQPVKDGDTVDLGGLTLKFIHFPWVHWPETMLTWVPERKLLFTCDLFGAHYCTNMLFSDGNPEIMIGAKRYFAELMLPYRNIIEKNMPKVTALGAEVICPSHGPVHKDTAAILEAYRGWLSDPPRNRVAVPYISMHDSTRQLVEHLVDELAHRGVPADQFDLSDPDIGKLSMLLVDAGTVVFGSPSLLAGAHPQACYAACLANIIKPKAMNVSVVGSFSWGGKTVEHLLGMMPNLKPNLIQPVLCKGAPRPADLQAVEALADAIVAAHQAAGLK